MKYLLIFLVSIQAAFGQDTSYLSKGDTVIWIRKDTAVLLSYPVYTKTIKPFKKPSSYLVLPMSEPIILTGKSNVVIEGKRFENVAGVMINISGSSNVIIRNCFFNKGGAEAIAIYKGTNIRVENCLFNGITTGVYASTSSTVKVINNQFVNVRARAGGNARGQFVQFNTVSGAGNEVSGNKGENFAGESAPEDLISMFKTYGTAASPVLIKNNMFRGGGPSQSGGGIVAGDYDGGYIRIEGNTLLNPGQYGIAIAGGSNHVITGNKIFSKQFAWSNNPLFIWAQVGNINCANNTIKNNRATWTNRSGIINGGWNAGNCSGTVWEYPKSITEAELNVPEHLIDFVTVQELKAMRGIN